jgi:hypothetical protein
MSIELFGWLNDKEDQGGGEEKEENEWIEETVEKESTVVRNKTYKVEGERERKRESERDSEEQNYEYVYT